MKLRESEPLLSPTLNYFDNKSDTSIDSESLDKRRSKIYKCVGITVGLTFVTVILTFALKKRQHRISPKLVTAYETIQSAAPTGYNVVLVGHDPLSIGDNEGLRANAPWSLDLWYSTRPSVGGNVFTNETIEDLWRPWSPWSDDIINSTEPLYVNINSRSELFLSNEPFYLKDEQYNSFPTKVQKAVELWNNLNVRAYINEYYVATFNQDKPAPEGGKVLHKIGLVSNDDIETLKSWGYGFLYDPKWPEGMQVYGFIEQYCHQGGCTNPGGSPGSPSICSGGITTEQLTGANVKPKNLWKCQSNRHCWEIQKNCGAVNNDKGGVCAKYWGTAGGYWGCVDYCKAYADNGC